MGGVCYTVLVKFRYLITINVIIAENLLQLGLEMIKL